MKTEDRYFQVPSGVVDGSIRNRVFQRQGDGDTVGVEVGSYTRNTWFQGPFYPFTQGGKDYALYCPTYTRVAVMSLPDCRMVAEEMPPEGNDALGFVSTELWVPRTPEKAWVQPYVDEVAGEWGVCTGCFWGVEWFSPIFYLDLTHLAEGRVTREDRFQSAQARGSLKDHVNVWSYTKVNPVVRVSREVGYRLTDPVPTGLLDTEVEAEAILRDLNTATIPKVHLGNVLANLLWGP